MKKYSLVLLCLLAAAAPVLAQTSEIRPYRVRLGNVCMLRTGSGTPEAAVTGTVCDTYWRTDTGTIYTKISGSGNTGWAVLGGGDVTLAGSQTLTNKTINGASNTLTVLLGTQVTGNLPVANLPADFAQVYVSTLTLTDAQIKELPTTPITIRVAPGAGFTVEPIWARLVTDATAGAYTNINAAGVLKIEHPSTSWPALATVPNDAAITNGSTARLSDLIGTANKRRAVLLPQQDAEAVDQWGFVPTVFNLSEVENKALQIRIDNGGSGNLTGGNVANTMKVVVYCIIESF